MSGEEGVILKIAKAIAYTAIAVAALAADGPESTPTEQRRVVLGRFPAAAQSVRVYEISVAACTAGKCPVEISLLDEQKLIARSALDWSAPEQQATRTSAGANYGIGDPLDTATRPEIWSWGDEEGSLSTGAQKVALSQAQRGLLIHQVTGIERLKRRHYLYVARGDELLRAWTATEQDGPHWTTVKLATAGSGAQSILLFEGFQPGGDQPDRLAVQRLVWDERRGTLSPSGDVPGLHTVTLGSWATVAEARQARSQAPECLSLFWVTPLGNDQAGPFTLRAVTADKELAAETLRRVQTCAPALKGGISKYQQ